MKAVRQKPKRDKQKDELAMVKKESELFSRLYIANSSRDGDLNKFFEHENDKFPSSISDEGRLYHGSKSDILDSFSKASIVPDTFDLTAIDGAAIVNMLEDPKLLTFD
ncbi:hypothetical protein DPMN_107196 [Dreissena polymorpha]|uniref:Uncharacterized protein n=1 Tax=Dreissena polymorpha TaxID=45954 RepID=A0A9D4QKP3_DREPO|nr:hypothetical protein DPMN_107196 [Dreissena polymorpha]